MVGPGRAQRSGLADVAGLRDGRQCADQRGRERKNQAVAAAATYLEAISVVSAPAGLKTAATIEPVELQHAAILHFVLGQYPVPDSFTKMDGARPLTDVIA